MFKGLILLPNALDPSIDSSASFVPILTDIVPHLSGLIAESEKGARLFLKRFTFKAPKTFRDISIYLLNEHSSKQDVEKLSERIKDGGSWGLLSDSGLPVVADPGAELIHLIHTKKIGVYAHPGPSSIMLALMLSGLSGQAFTFHGYLPRSIKDLEKKISSIQGLKTQTHLFIETPYRTEKLLHFLIEKLRDDLTLCVASNLMLPTQEVFVKKIKVWKREKVPDLNKKLAVFVIGSPFKFTK